MPRLLVSLVLPILAAQPFSPSKCTGGTLITARPDSLIVRMNQTTRTIRITSDTEVWRRGVDLDSATRLVPGDEIVPRCETTTADGTPVATLVAAVQTDDAIELVPHHVREIRVCGGALVAAHQTTVTVRADHHKTCVMSVTPQTVIWRGETFHDTTSLRRGDDIVARCFVHYPDESLTADEIDANLTAAEGKIAKVLPDWIVIDQGNPHERSAYPRGRVTVLIDSRSEFYDCTRADLQLGRHVRAQGLELARKTFRATVVHVYER